ncbi:MAG: toll/interleukin-1 receptor domain-containing protein [bacterium]|jgi:hypothetical protein
MSRALGIPVFFRSAPASPSANLPIEIPLEESSHSAIVALVEDHMVADDSWSSYIAVLWKKTRRVGSPHRLYPVALNANAFNLDRDVASDNFIRLYDIGKVARMSLLMSSLSHELCRILLHRPRIAQLGTAGRTRFSPAPITLFISHAKADGLKEAEALQRHIATQTSLKTFFDAQDLPPGFDFEKEIEANAACCTLVSIKTDAYASREWCRREVVAAKRYGSPLIVVNAVRRGEDRSFPYLGNVPTVRWMSGSARCLKAVTDLAITEVLRYAYFKGHLEEISRLVGVRGKRVCLPRPPELLNLLDIAGLSHGRNGRRPVVIYPDPPLGDEEMELVSGFAPGAVMTTPTQLPMNGG